MINGINFFFFLPRCLWKQGWWARRWAWRATETGQGQGGLSEWPTRAVWLWLFQCRKTVFKSARRRCHYFFSQCRHKCEWSSLIVIIRTMPLCDSVVCKTYTCSGTHDVSNFVILLFCLMNQKMWNLHLNKSLIENFIPISVLLLLLFVY